MLFKQSNKLFKPLLLVLYLTATTYSTGASAAVVIDFGTGLSGSGGTIVNNATGIIGTAINIGSLTAVGTAADGTYVTNALLDFNTSDNTISIIGSISDLGINSAITLLTGTFDSWSFGTTNNGVSANFSGSGTDTKHDDLLNALGVSTATEFEFFAFTLGFDFDADGNATAISTDIINTSAVPIPAAAWLFASGLLGITVVARKKHM